MNRVLIALIGFLLSTFSLAAQSQAQQASSDQAPSSTIRSSAQEVVLDMVFRDKKGKTVRDIRPEEIHVSEEGVEQKVTSFQLLEGNTVRSLGLTKSSIAETGPTPLDPTR